MRILFLTTDIYGGHGGIALFNREFVAALLTAAEVEEVVVVPRIIPRPDQHMDVPSRVRFVTEGARGKLAYLNALRRLRNERFDLVICGHVNLLPVAVLMGSAPLLVTHGIDAWRPFRSIAARKLIHRCRGIISVSAVTRDRLVGWSHYSGPTYVLPNAVHLEQYGIRQRRSDLVARYGLEGKRVLLTVGRLLASERYKGCDEVIELLPRLPEDVVYLIAGGGDDHPRLVQKARDLGVGHRLVMTGVFAEEEKADLYALADIYVMPSRGEGFGFVFIEALASGLPAIGSRHDGGREALLNGELGLLVDPSNPDEILAAIEEALARGEKRVPEGLDYFSFEGFCERVAEIVRDAVHSG